MQNKEVKKLIEFILNDGKCDRHFEITGQIQLLHDKVGYPFLEADDVCLYEITDEQRDIFEPTATRWATGERLRADDALHDVLQRYIRNETDGFNVLYVEPEVHDMAAVYRKRISFTYEGREIPYQIIDNDMQYVYSLLLATNKYLYYCSTDTIIMVTTKEGSLVANDFFAEVGYFDSECAIEKGMEEKLVFKKYLHPKKPYEIGMSFDLWQLM